MAHVYTVGSLKGGVGKTKCATNVAAELARRGNQVLLIDMDPQGDSTGNFGIAPEPGYSIGELLNTPAPYNPPNLVDVIVEVPNLPGMAVASASYAPLEAAERSLEGTAGALSIKSKIVDQVREHFDYIFLDTPPRLGMLTQAAVHASDFAVPIIGPRSDSYSGALSFAQLVKDIEMFSPVRIPFWIAANWSPGSEADQITAALAEDGIPVLDTHLPESKRASSAPTNLGLPLAVAQPGYEFSQAVRSLVDDLLARQNKAGE